MQQSEAIFGLQATSTRMLSAQKAIIAPPRSYPPYTHMKQQAFPQTNDDDAASPATNRRRVSVSLRELLPLVAVLLLATYVDFRDLSADAFGNMYYAAAVKSMLPNWHNFFFVSFDPGGFASVEKPPPGLWIQAISAKLLGFSGVSLMLSQAVAGVFSVAVLYFLVRRHHGSAAALLSAGIYATTLISLVSNRDSTLHSLVVLAALLAAWCVSKALECASLRWLLLGAVMVGRGFNVKMPEVYLVLPALVVLYILGTPVRWQRQATHLPLAGLMLGVVSLSWVIDVDSVPAQDRPYVGSSRTNSENYNSADLTIPLQYQGVTRETIVVEDDCWIASHAVILTGLIIAHGSIVAAGSVATHDVPPYSVVGGAPARIIKSRLPQQGPALGKSRAAPPWNVPPRLEATESPHPYPQRP